MGENPYLRAAFLASFMQTILVVDDEAVIRQSLCQFLTVKGYSVIPAEDGQMALELFDNAKVDGVLLDVRMEGLNGIEVCVLLRERARIAGNDLPVWMVTGDHDPDIQRKAVSAGALAVIRKPISFEEIISNLSARLGRAACA